MKKWMSLLLAALLVLGMSPFALAEVEKNPVGTVEDNVYANDLFGFRMTLPENWKFLSDAEIADHMGYESEFASREGLAALLERDSSVCAMFCADKDDPASTSNFMIQDLGSFKDLDERTYLNLAEGSLLDALKPQGFTDIQLTKQTFLLGEVEHRGAVLTASLGTVQLYMIVVLVKADKYMGSLTIGATSQEKAEAILAFCSSPSEDEAALGTSQGQAYENKTLGLAITLDENWYVMNEEERAQQMGLVAASISSNEDLSKTFAEALEGGQQVFDLSFQRKDGSGDNGTIILSKLTGMSLLLDEKAYCQAGKDSIEQYFTEIGCDRVAFSEEGEITFCNKTHYSMLIEASLKGVTFYEQQIYIKSGAYFGVLTVFSMDKTHLGEMLDMFEPCE